MCAHCGVNGFVEKVSGWKFLALLGHFRRQIRLMPIGRLIRPAGLEAGIGTNPVGRVPEALLQCGSGLIQLDTSPVPLATGWSNARKYFRIAFVYSPVAEKVLEGWLLRTDHYSVSSVRHK